jgi:hypothetical protein
MISFGLPPFLLGENKTASVVVCVHVASDDLTILWQCVGNMAKQLVRNSVNL